MPTTDPATGMPPMSGRRLSIPEWLSYVAAYDFGTIPPSRLVPPPPSVPTLPHRPPRHPFAALSAITGPEGIPVIWWVAQFGLV